MGSSHVRFPWREHIQNVYLFYDQEDLGLYVLLKKQSDWNQDSLSRFILSVRILGWFDQENLVCLALEGKGTAKEVKSQTGWIQPIYSRKFRLWYCFFIFYSFVAVKWKSSCPRRMLYCYFIEWSKAMTLVENKALSAKGMEFYCNDIYKDQKNCWRPIVYIFFYGCQFFIFLKRYT